MGTAAEFEARLGDLREAAAGRLPMRQVFDLARALVDTAPGEIEFLLESDDLEARVGAVSIMDFQARRKSTSDLRRTELYELYLRRHDRIDTWQQVDRAAPHVVGGHLWDRPREPLYRLAAAPHWWERRTAIVSTWFFIRRGDLDDTFRIGGLLAHDPEHFVQTAVGGWVREAGKRDRQALLAFLDRHAATMPRTALRYATEHLPPDLRTHYRDAART